MKITCRELFLVVFLFLSNVRFAWASPYPQYLNENKNLVLVAGHQGVAWYLQLDSINVECCRLPYHVVSARLVGAMAKDCFVENFDMVANDDFLDMEFYYDTKNGKMFIADKDGILTWINPEGSYAEVGVALPTARYLWNYVFAKAERFLNVLDIN